MSEKTMQDAICQALLNAFPMADKVADGYAAVAVKAISTLSLPEQAPVGWMSRGHGAVIVFTVHSFMRDEWAAKGMEITPLYASPQPEAVITDEMVERALSSWWGADPGPTDTSYRDAMRAALTAASSQPINHYKRKGEE